jgi:hypothetical protein
LKHNSAKKNRRFKKILSLDNIIIDLAVVRVLHNGDAACSRPCMDCGYVFERLKKLGITINVEYVNEDGNLDTWTVSNCKRRSISCWLF